MPGAPRRTPVVFRRSDAHGTHSRREPRPFTSLGVRSRVPAPCAIRKVAAKHPQNRDRPDRPVTAAGGRTDYGGLFWNMGSHHAYQPARQATKAIPPITSARGCRRSAAATGASRKGSAGISSRLVVE